MERDARYTPENMVKTRIAPEFAGILFDNAKFTQAIADSGRISTIVIPDTLIENVRPTTNPVTPVNVKRRQASNYT